MMRFDIIVSILIKPDVFCFKMGECNNAVVIPWTELTSSQSKITTKVHTSRTSHTKIRLNLVGCLYMYTLMSVRSWSFQFAGF